MLRKYSLNSMLYLREFILKSYKQNAMVIINAYTIGIAAADCTVKCRDTPACVPYGTTGAS